MLSFIKLNIKYIIKGIETTTNDLNSFVITKSNKTLKQLYNIINKAILRNVSSSTKLGYQIKGTIPTISISKIQ